MFDLIKAWWDYFDSKGYIDGILPFFAVFVVSYAILNKIKFFKNKSSPVAIAFVFAIAFVLPHYTGFGPNLVPFLNLALPSFAFFLVLIFSFQLIAGLFGAPVGRQALINLFAILIIIDLILPDLLIISLILREFDVDVPPWLENFINFFTSDGFIIFAIVFICLWTNCVFHYKGTQELNKFK